ncbi:U4/U6.U5 tri-snRNP-associated protein 1 [Pseudolycoriella hygida]|uniref:U4/U6.U5 tri-snRNP-associated protein 1 n=1 Tax=Pseudolycoriella hygida TaxID=35572 RepID=A0A9Q0MIU0_9DIPT|nr:U4/U6.U5 tri-snRNP-associated protein 1 [Pseudolycoriella hygida]
MCSVTSKMFEYDPPTKEYATDPKIISRNVKCLVCQATILEMEKEIKKVDPRKKVEVSGFRMDSDGFSEMKSVQYSKSETYLTELMDTICKKMEDYAKARHKTSRKLLILKMVTDEGTMNPLMSAVDFVQDGDLNKSLEHFCLEVLEDHEEAILTEFMKDVPEKNIDHIKHKKESRKRDRSPDVAVKSSSRFEREREKDRRERQDRHKKHKSDKSRKHDSRHGSSRTGRAANRDDYHSDSSDVVEIIDPPPAPIISSKPPPAPSISSKPPPAPIISRKSRSISPIPDGGAGDVLSIAETNKLRAKLGLKPLETNSDTTAQEPKKDADGLKMHKDEWGEFLHKPADNLADKLQAEKLREKFRQKKEKRQIDNKLKTIKGLGESDDFDDINAWIEHSREKEKLKAEALKRAKMLEEMDEELASNEVSRPSVRKGNRNNYTEKNLRGLKVGHNMESFGEGKTVILTLKDHDVLAEDEDELVNVNMIDDERYKKNTEVKKKNPNQYGYDVYEEQYDEFGEQIHRNILGKYDEEIDGIKPNSFSIGETLEDERAQKRRLLEIKAKLAGKKLESLDEPSLKLASDVYTDDELAKFKKPKKKVKKLRRKLKAEDLLPLSGSAESSSKDYGKRLRLHNDHVDTDDVVDTDFKDIKIEEEDNELEKILSKTRRLKQKESLITKSLTSVEASQDVKMEVDSDDDNGEIASKDNICLNETAEFCRTLGDIPTYGMSGNRDEDAGDMMDFEQEHFEPDEPVEEKRSTGGTWNSVNPDLEAIVEDKSNEMIEVAILDEEPDVGSGMGAALKLALSKGYLEREETNRPSNTRMAHLQAKNYSIEDKAYGEDEKFQRRDRYHSGPISEFKEKESYRPNVKLEYIDDSGRLLNEKEAFRYLSHKFHGKGPGKNKIEKRLKKNEQDGLMMKMSSTDTPLGTLTMLQHKQKETHSPYIVLSGSKQAQSTSITKHK